MNLILDSSKLTDMMRCPRYFFYRHHLGWRPEDTSHALVFGECWHTAQEHLLNHGYSPSIVEDAMMLFLTRYRENFSPQTDDMYYPKNPGFAREMLLKYIKKYSDDLSRYKVLYTEIAGAVSISKNRQIYFKMDNILFDTEKNMYTSLEHKTTSSAFFLPHGLKIQNGTYTHVLYCLYEPTSVYGIIINGSIFQKTKPDHTRLPMPRSARSMQVWLETVNAWYAAVEREYDILSSTKKDTPVLSAFYLNPEGCHKYNRMCEYFDFCIAWPNPLIYSDQPPQGFIQEFWDPRKVKASINIDLTTKEPPPPSVPPKMEKLACDRWRELSTKMWSYQY